MTTSKPGNALHVPVDICDRQHYCYDYRGCPGVVVRTNAQSFHTRVHTLSVELWCSHPAYCTPCE